MFTWQFDLMTDVQNKVGPLCYKTVQVNLIFHFFNRYQGIFLFWH